jgi:hypothetical protein
MPFLLWGQEGHWQGFSLNIIISFFAMLLGTVAGAALGFRAGAQRVLVGHPVFSQFPVAGAVVYHHVVAALRNKNWQCDHTDPRLDQGCHRILPAGDGEYFRGGSRRGNFVALRAISNA